MKFCGLYQKAMPFWLEEAHPPRWLERHLDRCPGCRAAWQEEKYFIDHLARHSTARPEAPPFLRTRIMARVRAEGAPAPAVPVWRPAAVVGVGLTVALGLLFLPGKLPPPAVVSVAPRPADPALDLPRVVKGTDLVRLVARIDEPLEEELQSVVNDARTALNSLAYNFVPSSKAVISDQ